MNTHYVDIKTKLVSKSDLIIDTLYPIFTQDKVSYQCTTPITITLDDQPYYCNTNTLQFVPFPTIIKLNDTLTYGTYIWHTRIHYTELTPSPTKLSNIKWFYVLQPHNYLDWHCRRFLWASPDAPLVLVFCFNTSMHPTNHPSLRSLLL